MKIPMKGGKPLTTTVGRLAAAIMVATGIYAVTACIYSFAVMARDVHDALVLTAYKTDLAPGQQTRFGYGGDGENDQVNVPFQGREMSNVAFVIARPSADRVTINGRDDQIRVGRQWYEPGEEATLTNKTRIETSGWMARAKFQVVFDEQSSKLSLLLETPLYYELDDSETRLAFGSKHQPVPVSKDEIFLRTSPLGRTGEESFNLVVRDGKLYPERESDGARESTPGGVSLQVPTEMRHNDTWDYASLELKFRHLSGIKWFGVRLVLMFFLLGLIFWKGPQVHWPNESLVFVGVAFLMGVGICLSAHSYLFGNHNQYFPKYIEFFYYACMLLFWLRVPFGPQTTLRDVGGVRALLWVWLVFMLIHLLINKPFEEYKSAWEVVLSLFVASLLFAGIGVVVLVGTETFQRLLKRLTESQWSIVFFVLLVLSTLLLPLLLMLAAYFTGGREAVALTPSFRVYLPSVLGPFMVLSTTVLVVAARTQPSNRTIILIATVLVMAVVTAVYRMTSEDNGGTAVLTIGMVTAFGLAWRHWLLPIVLMVAFLAAISIGAYLNKPERFDLSVGSEQSLQYFDQARNLRLARDMARAGGWFGMGQRLEIPSGLISNLHNDLVAAYVAGYCGWIVLLLVFVAYALTYDGLWRGQFGILQAYPDGKRDAPDQNLRIRQVLVIVSVSLLVVSIVQTLWVATAALQGLVPMTGLDLQPISASRISLQNFFVALLGSVAVAHTNHRALPI